MYKTKSKETELVEKHKRLIFYVTKQMPSDFRSRYEDDLIQQGYVGLLKAIRLYDSSKAKFSTFAIMTIRQSMYDYLVEYAQPITLHINLRGDLHKINNVLSINGLDKNKISKKELYDLYKTSHYYGTLKYTFSTVYKALLASSTKYYKTIEDTFLEDTNNIKHEDIVYAEQKRKFIESSLNHLSDRDKNIIYSRYGFSGESKSVEECAKLFNCTKERIQQIETRSLKKIKHTLLGSGEKLKEFQNTY